MYKVIKIFILIILIGLFIFPIYALTTNFEENATQGFAELAFLIIFELVLFLKINNSQSE
ncbi:hypothetical protein CV702_11315 [Lactococcus lactis subsp. lactis]|nr:hypothetical protein CV702_11315 [Lactococcus lactis subsp. lactis]ATZ02318.1 hypothetical protein CV098_11310 [Lactococcus lactis subsp. lactis]